MKNNKTWKVLTAVLLCALIVVGCLYALGVGWKTQDAQPAVSGEEMLSLWTQDAASKKALIEYIDAVTDAGGADFIPVEKRIAVFDLDGTLFCETDPNYFDYCLLKYRVLDDPDYKDKASGFEKEVANKIKEQNETGASFEGLEVDHGKAVASAFSGMTVTLFIFRFFTMNSPPSTSLSLSS